MKAKYIYLAMMALATSFGFTACSDDDDDNSYPTPNQVEKSNLAFDTDTVQVGVNETATFNITDGAGDYKIISEDTTVAKATVNGSTVTVTGQNKGITGLVVSDAKGGYKRVLVKSMFFKMTLNKSEVQVGMKLGHTDGTATVKVIEGNGNYTATSADESVAKVAQIVDDFEIVIQGVATGSTTITVTDMMGLSQTVKVTVETTDVPYSADEIEEIKNEDISTFVWDGNSKGNWEDWLNKKSGDNSWLLGYGYGWNGQIYSGTYIEFDGALTEGAKYTGKLTSMDWYSNTVIDGVTVEIIKVEDGKVWGIMSVIKDNYLHYGYFIVDTTDL